MVSKSRLGRKALETFSNNDTVDAVLTGDADAGAMSSVVLDKYLSLHPELRRLPMALDNFAFAIGLAKGDEAMVHFVNQQVGEMVRQGYVTLAEAVRRATSSCVRVTSL